MSGIKQIRQIGLCGAPCCPGYKEMIDRAPLLKPIIYCQKL